MEIIVLLLKQNLVMFVYLVIGYFLYKKKLVSVQGSADIGRILLYIIMPAAILKSYLAEFSMERLEGLAVSFLAALLSLLLAIAAARIALFFLPVFLPDTIENVVGTIAASAPVGSNVAIFEQLYQQDYMQAVKEVCLSTLLCIISLPLILGIANYIL